MHTVRFEPVRLSVSVATIICYSHKSLGRSRKFEHVSSDYYQMPLAGWWGPGVGEGVLRWVVMSKGWGSREVG